MEDIFNTDFTMEENSQPPKMTKDEFIKKTRSMLQAIMEGYSSNWKDKFDEDDLVAAILHRAELEYEFCSAGDADPVTLQIQKACAEYEPTDGFPHTFYKEVVSKVILYRDTHIEFKLQNGQIV